jgi:hypothetical protein
MSQPHERNDLINRILWSLAAIAAIAGIITLAGAEQIFHSLLSPAAGRAFAFDPAFLSGGAMLVVAMWIMSGLHYAAVFAEGRWQPHTRLLGLVLDVMWCAALLWLVAGPRIYLSPTTDSTAKGFIALVLALVLLTLIPKLMRSGLHPR